MMARAAAFALIEHLADSRMNLKAYCRQQGIHYTAMTARFRRAGIRPGRELLRRRVQRAIDIKTRHPHWSWRRAAIEAGFPFAQNFYRLRLRLKTMGHEFTWPQEPTPDERLGQAFRCADALAAAIERTLRRRPSAELQRAVVEYRVAASHVIGPKSPTVT